MPPIYIGSSQIIKRYIGSTVVTKVCLGVQEIYGVAQVWRQFATACYAPRETLTDAGVPTGTQMMSRSSHFARASVTTLKIAIPNWVWAAHAEAGVGGAPTCEASIEYPAGTFNRLLFSGADVGTLPSASYLLSDQLSISIPSGAQFWVRIYRSGFSAGMVPIVLRRISALGEQSAYGTAVANMVMGGTIGNTGSPQFKPCAIITDNASLTAPLLLGDSRCFGVGESGDGQGDTGELARGFGMDVGYINMGIGSDRSDWWLASHTNRASMAQWCSHVVCQLGINDLGASRTAAQLMQSIKDIRAVFPDKPFYQATVTVSQASVGAQATFNAARVAFNDILRLWVAEFSGYFETADVLEGSSYNSGVAVRNGGWIATAANYSDLLHETIAGYIAIRDSGAVRASMLAQIVGIRSPSTRPSVLGLGGYGISSGTGFYTGYTNYNFRMRAKAGPDVVVDPVVRFNSYIMFGTGGYVVAPNAFTINVAVEYNGVNYPVTFGGATSYAMSAASAVVDADPIIGVTIPVGGEFFIRTNVTVSVTTDKVPSGRSRYPTSNTVEQAILGGTNNLTSGIGAMTTVGAGSGAAFNSYSFGPVAVLSSAPATSVSIAFMGDSIPNGFSFDTTPDADGNYGWAARASNAAGKPFVNLTRGSNKSQWSTPTASPGQYTNCDAATHFVWALGTNDLNTGRTLGSLQADTTLAFVQARTLGLKVIAYKILPRTNASNVCISAAFDPAGTNLRGLYNAWLDTLLAAGLIDYVRDFNPLCENGTTGTWASYSTHTVDGTHPTPALYDLMVAQEAAFYATLAA